MPNMCEMCQKTDVTVLVNLYGTVKEICRDCEFDYFHSLMESDHDLKRVKELLDGKKSRIQDGLDMIVRLNTANVRRVYETIVRSGEKKG